MGIQGCASYLCHGCLHTPIPSQMLASELCTGNSLDGPFPHWPGGHNVHDFQKQFEMWTCSTTAHFPTLLQSISDELEHREAGDISGCCWYRAFTLHCWVLTCTCRSRDNLSQLTVVFWCVCSVMGAFVNYPSLDLILGTEVTPALFTPSFWPQPGSTWANDDDEDVCFIN